MKDGDYFDFEDKNNHEGPPYDNYESDDIDDNYSGYEPAISAVERLLKTETSEFVDGYDRRHSEHTPKTPPADEKEYMERLAYARMERQRLKEQNPTPKPAVRVNTERKRAPAPSGYHEEAEWAPFETSGFDTFRNRYTADMISQPKEARMKAARAKEASPPPVKKKRQQPASFVDNVSPLRYLLAFVFVGILALMAYMASNNRSLRRDLDEYQTRLARVEDNSADLARADIYAAGLNARIDYLENSLDEAESQLQALQAYLGHGVSEDPSTDDYQQSSSRPADEAPTDLAPPPVSTNYVIHVVQPGEVLSRIARQHFGSNAQRYVDMIVEATPGLNNPNDIRVGQELIIPIRE